MVILIIAGVILFLAAVILLSPLTLTAEYYADSNAKVTLKYGFISLFGRKILKEGNVTVKKEKPRKPEKQNKPVREKSKNIPGQAAAPEQEPFKPDKPGAVKNTLIKAFDYSSFGIIKELLDTASPLLKWIINRLKLRVYAVVAAGGEDAAVTAVTYGYFCTAVSIIVNVLDSHVKFQRKRITVLADFSADKSTVKIKASVSAVTWELLYIGIQGYRKLVLDQKNKNKQKK
jgi:hypothetical protein